MSIGADHIVSILETLGARRAFGIPGGPLSGIFHALSQSSRIQVTLTQHEAAAAYIAMGARLFDRDPDAIPIVFATAGPGMMNLITGVASASEESVPLFVLTANVALALRGSGAVQDSYSTGLDAVSMFKPITSASEVLWRIEDAESAITLLYKNAKETRRPVHLNLPADVAHQRFESRFYTRQTEFISGRRQEML